MRAFLEGLLIVLPALALSACQQPLLTNAGRRPFAYDLPARLATSSELLPAGRDVCERLGLDPNIAGRCNCIAVLNASARQTDRTLWFYKTSTGPILKTCPGAVAFERNKTGGQVTFLCGQPDEDVTIATAELRAFEAAINRLNATKHKTLAEHTRAIEIKTEIACHIGTSAADCP